MKQQSDFAALRLRLGSWFVLIISVHCRLTVFQDPGAKQNCEKVMAIVFRMMEEHGTALVTKHYKT